MILPGRNLYVFVFYHRGGIMGVMTRIEVIDPNIPEKPLIKLTVPGSVVPEQIRKSIQVGLTLKIDLGDKTKKKTTTIKVFDEDLRRLLEDYVNSLEIRLVEIESEERVIGEIKLSDIKSE